MVPLPAIHLDGDVQSIQQKYHPVNIQVDGKRMVLGKPD